MAGVAGATSHAGLMVNEYDFNGLLITAVSQGWHFYYRASFKALRSEPGGPSHLLYLRTFEHVRPPTPGGTSEHTHASTCAPQEAEESEDKGGWSTESFSPTMWIRRGSEARMSDPGDTSGLGASLGHRPVLLTFYRGHKQGIYLISPLCWTVWRQAREFHGNGKREPLKGSDSLRNLDTIVFIVCCIFCFWSQTTWETSPGRRVDTSWEFPPGQVG